MITIDKMKAKPKVSAQKMADDLIAGNPVEAAPAVPTFEMELKLTGSLEDIREIVDFVKSKATQSSTAVKTS